MPDNVEARLEKDTNTPTGRVGVTGVANVCPIIDALSSIPTQLAVGSSVSLSATVHDPDGDKLTYAWAASSGSPQIAFGPSLTFACTVPGPVVLTLIVADGDPTPGCPALLTVRFPCVSAAPVDAGPG